MVIIAIEIDVYKGKKEGREKHTLDHMHLEWFR